MKIKRALQISLGVLATIAAAAIACAALTMFIVHFTELGAQSVRDTVGLFIDGLEQIAPTFGLQNAALLALLTLGIPFALFVLGLALLFSKNKGHNVKYLIGVIAVMPAIVGLTTFLVAGSRLLFGEDKIVAACLITIAVTLVYLAIAICSIVLPRTKAPIVSASAEVATVEIDDEDEDEDEDDIDDEDEIDEDEDEVSEESELSPLNSETELQHDLSVSEQVTEFLRNLQQEQSEKPETAVEETKPETVEESMPETRYIPSDKLSVRSIVENAYGKPMEEISADTMVKINKIRLLYEAHALTQDEYIKLVNSYLDK